MPNVFEFDGVRPVIHESAFVHPNATITGHVTIGRDVYIGPGAAIRGDWGAIEIAASTRSAPCASGWGRGWRG